MKNRLPIILPLLLALALLLTGCGQPLNNAATTSTENPATAAKQPPATTPFPPPATAPPPPRTDWPMSALPPAGLGGLANPHLMTAAEQAAVLALCLAYPTTANWLQGRNDYRITHYEWYAITWTYDGNRSAYFALSESEYAASGVPNYINPHAFWYPGLTIAIGESTIYQMQIAVDLESGKIVIADGPYPSLSSPDRFK